jgi:selenocysteine-specific elongation factor
MKHVIIGTAGHVDHGKTSLILALTGTNTDRLKEEQERGMTIDIGFAALKLPDGTVASIVDVPGHERFLKNMLAGASGVDVVLLVVAGDESVMPQTVEHLDILRLLDVRNGVVALTKSDLVDKEWADTVEDDIRDHLKDTFLSAAPIVRVSSVTGKGIEALKKALLSAVSRAEARNTAVPFRLPIDRIFTRPGFGTVVTGTLSSGTIRVGDALEIQPQNLASRVRGLQVHNQKVGEADAGCRVAVNLASIEPDAIERGAVIAAPGSLTATETFDAYVRLLPHAPRPLKDRTRVRIHTGTAEIIGRLRILDERNELVPGERCYVQFRAEQPFACLRGDRFVVRSYSPLQTIGGGVVLDSSPQRHRKADPAMLSALAARERGTPEDLIDTFLQNHPYSIAKKEVLSATGIPSQQAGPAISALTESGKVTALPADRLITSSALRAVTERAVNTLTAYHERYPLRPGMPKEEFRAALGRNVESRAMGSLCAQWLADDRVIVEGAVVRLAQFEVALSERQQALLLRIEEYYQHCGIAMPQLAEVVSAVNAPPDAVSALLRVGVERGRFHRLEDDQYYHADTIANFQAMVSAYIEEHGVITVSGFRDLTQSNRKFSMIVLEYFDQIRFTRRQGDDRVLVHQVHQ